MLREVFADAGGEAHRVLDALTGAEEFYYEDLAQIRMTRWSRGRVALVGDAAY